MDKQNILARIAEIGVVPVVRASSAETARMAAEAVAEGGIPIVEITMTVPGAVDVIRELAETAGDRLLVGAGTVLDAEMAERCLGAGAQFLVSPGFDRKTVELASRRGIAMLAGALTPTEILTAWRAGSDFVKVFPCKPVGGPAYIRALRGPLPQVPLVPTGGVNLENAADFIRAGATALGVGSELVKPDALRAGKPAVVTEIAAKLLAIVREARAEMAARKASARN
jgi:2-dehydro-3-deoxyphosphogluconate aldolase/(4S)-4-hydroxy-2-oxoglutarate aldolase